jgi:SAM-dependent methyltransferase
MTDRVFEEYRKIFRRLTATPRAVLEVGALPAASSLITCAELNPVPLKVGINLRESGSYRGIAIMRMDARRMAFPDDLFDLVVCSSTLEHIPDFWRACEEMQRVLAPGGLLVLNTPGFSQSRAGNIIRHVAFKLHLPDFIRRGTITMRVHDAPADYYRFSEYTYRDVLLAGLSDLRTWSIMTPPRVFGTGQKSGDGASARAG